MRTASLQSRAADGFARSFRDRLRRLARKLSVFVRDAHDLLTLDQHPTLVRAQLHLKQLHAVVQQGVEHSCNPFRAGTGAAQLRMGRRGEDTNLLKLHGVETVRLLFVFH
jgi:hypothetical protein